MNYRGSIPILEWWILGTPSTYLASTRLPTSPSFNPCFVAYFNLGAREPRSYQATKAPSYTPYSPTEADSIASTYPVLLSPFANHNRSHNSSSSDFSVQSYVFKWPYLTWNLTDYTFLSSRYALNYIKTCQGVDILEFFDYSTENGFRSRAVLAVQREPVNGRG